MCCIELFSSLPKEFHNPIKTHILKACHRNELIVRRLDGLQQLTRDGSGPKSLKLVKLNLSCNNNLKNNPETCQHPSDETKDETRSLMLPRPKHLLIQLCRRFEATIISYQPFQMNNTTEKTKRNTKPAHCRCL